jgi:putative DNA primase/helicase
MNHIAEFIDFMTAAGLSIDDRPIDDGELHRFTPKNDRPNSNNGWYVLYNGDLPAGVVRSWKTGEQHNWRSKSTGTISEFERKKLRREREIVKAKQKQIQLKNQTRAANECEDIWQKSTPAKNHPYLTAKNITSYGARLYRGQLIVPVRGEHRDLTSLQYIAADKSKRFHTGGRVSGCYCSLGILSEKLFICEGYATGVTIYEHTGQAVAIAFHAGNLLSVAKSIRADHSNLVIVIAADNDHEKSSNVGMEKAIEAAQEIGALITLPPNITGVSDFNDYDAYLRTQALEVSV